MMQVIGYPNALNGCAYLFLFFLRIITPATVNVVKRLSTILVMLSSESNLLEMISKKAMPAWKKSAVVGIPCLFTFLKKCRAG